MKGFGMKEFVQGLMLGLLSGFILCMAIIR